MTHLDLFLQKGPNPHPSNPALTTHASGLEDLRRTLLLDPLPSSADGLSELRIYIWLILLNAPPLSTKAYLDLVGQGASPAYAKIRDDTFRTLTTDPLFRRRVSENSLTRVLNAVAWKLCDREESRREGWNSPPMMNLSLNVPDNGSDIFHSPASVTSAGGGNNDRPSRFARGSVTEDSEADSTTAHTSVGYVQGMNVMAAPFLYAARSEVEAFAAFDRYVTHECPGYVRGSMEGVHKGLALVDQILGIVDPKLASHLLGKGMKAEIYAFPSVLTLCACTPPLPEVLRLWDFLFAYGAGLNLLCIVSQVVLIRDQLLSTQSPKPDFKPLRAQKVIDYTVNFARKIPEDVYEQMLSHAK
ncbi:CDC16 protein [Saxophila tyrrhenica]|uniref:CDC16 protein n=1 Tax=Saxophila tyrrhenica TaxID=1690608 RepID=A0AAV9PF94_9PEZI|nr:CDC16 protein [Saxophila tyrrhenica]